MSTAEDQPKDDKPFLWKWATVLAIVALLISLFFNLYDRFWRMDGPVIVASVASYPFQLPPPVVASLPARGPTELDEEIAEAIDEAEGAVKNPSRLRKFRGYMTLSVSNVGNLEATGVRIQFRDRGLAYVTWDDSETKQVRIDHDLEIGSLPVAKSFSVAAWTDNFISPEGEPLLVAHSTGSATLPFANSNKAGVPLFSAIGLLLGSIIATVVVVRRITLVAVGLALDKAFKPLMDKIEKKP